MSANRAGDHQSAALEAHIAMLAPENKKLRAEIKAQTHCAMCRRRRPCEPHHHPTRGAGGSDFSVMMLGICRECHSLRADTAQGRAEVMRLIADRHECTVKDLEEVHWFLTRMSKPTKNDLLLALEDLPAGARALAETTLRDSEQL